MNTGRTILEEAARMLSRAGGGMFGALSPETRRWLEARNAPPELLKLWEDFAFRSEAWAGSGSFFDESKMREWNNDLPEAMASDLLIVGSAANGDHICLDLKTGQVGYLSHEQAWQNEPRRFFISVSESLGSYIGDINARDCKIPEDYWEARSRAARRKP